MKGQVSSVVPCDFTLRLSTLGENIIPRRMRNLRVKYYFIFTRFPDDESTDSQNTLPPTLNNVLSKLNVTFAAGFARCGRSYRGKDDSEHCHLCNQETSNAPQDNGFCCKCGIRKLSVLLHAETLDHPSYAYFK